MLFPNDPFVAVKPPLRWVGGKSWLVQDIRKLLVGNNFKKYYEPFLGGASIFFSLQPKKAFLSDLNGDLINTYKVIRDKPQELIETLRVFKNTENFYYKIRQIEFNTGIEKAAQFIYLNQTSFNGIYRVNRQGLYNVPYGFRKKNFLQTENLKTAGCLLKKAQIFHCDFDEIKNKIAKHDLIFLDPPYTVSHNLNGFIKYNQKLFSIEDQHRLSKLIDYVKTKDAYYILTNAAHDEILKIFDKKDKIIKLQRNNLIGGLYANRGITNELLFTNLKIKES